MRMREGIAVAAILAAGGLYPVARPALAESIPRLALWEMPLTAALLVVIAILGFRRRRERRPAQEQIWRRHAQRVRVVPDPELARNAEVVERWVDSGAGAALAAQVLARASTPDVALRARSEAAIAAEIARADSRAKRQKLIRSVLKENESRSLT